MMHWTLISAPCICRWRTSSVVTVGRSSVSRPTWQDICALNIRLLLDYSHVTFVGIPLLWNLISPLTLGSTLEKRGSSVAIVRCCSTGLRISSFTSTRTPPCRSCARFVVEDVRMNLSWSDTCAFILLRNLSPAARVRKVLLDRRTWMITYECTQARNRTRVPSV